jgi:hypothetical protein
LQPSTLAKRGSILLFVAFILFYFYGLGHLPFIGPDEPRYAEVAREMFLRRDWITPTLGGYLWFEKPALLYWMATVSFKLFGVSEWSARATGANSFARLGWLKTGRVTANRCNCKQRTRGHRGGNAIVSRITEGFLRRSLLPDDRNPRLVHL